MPDNTWNFDVSRIALDNVAIDASAQLGFVLAQPRYELDPHGTPPFRIQQPFRQKQIDVLTQSFLIRQTESATRQIPFPFIVLPEYSIPTGTPDGLQALQTQINSCAKNLVFIAGIEGLTKAEFEALVARFPPTDASIRPSVPDAAFINTCVIVIKDNAGNISWYFQPKLAASQWEEPKGMAEGNTVFYFHGANTAFLCQLCFDHIAERGNDSLSAALCQRLQVLRGTDATRLDFLFVPQYNESPLSDAFLSSSSTILEHEHPQFNSALTAVVAVNRAGNNQEPGKFASSGLYYRAGRWQVNPTVLGPDGYKLTEADNTTSAIFRKRTEAIHAFGLTPASQNLRHSGNPRIPISDVHSYLLSSDCDGPECCCRPVTASSAGNYVRCMPLPCTLRDAILTNLPNTDLIPRWLSAETSNTNRFLSHYSNIRNTILALDTRRANALIDLLFCGVEQRRINPDVWVVDSEFDALAELTSILCVLAEQTSLNLSCSGPWTAEFGTTAAVVILDGGDIRKLWADLQSEYLKKYESDYYRPENRTRNVLLVAQRSNGQPDHRIQQVKHDITVPTTISVFANDDTPFASTQNKFYLCKSDIFYDMRADSTGVTMLNREMGAIL